MSCNSYEELARGERSLGREGERERGREGERERGREGERERGREGERERGREGEIWTFYYSSRLIHLDTRLLVDEIRHLSERLMVQVRLAFHPSEIDEFDLEICVGSVS